jgi:hypothetical protein
MEDEQVISYFDSLKILFDISGDHKTQCEGWIKVLRNLGDKKNWNIDELPTLLALVHPYFYYDSRGVEIGSKLVPPHNKRSFTDRKIRSQSCGIEILILGCKCPYWSGHVLLEPDHLWPHSLGGATLEENRLSLCKQCNQHKSASPMLFPGNSVPNWLKDRVQQLYAFKSRFWP